MGRPGLGSETGVDVWNRPPDELLPRIAEKPAGGVVHIEDRSIGRDPKHGIGRPIHRELRQAKRAGSFRHLRLERLIRLQHSRFCLQTVLRMDKNLAEGPEQEDIFVRPHFGRLHGVEADKAERPTSFRNRHGDQGLNALRLERQALGLGLRRKLGDARNGDRLVARQPCHPPGKRVDRQLLQLVLLR